MKRIITILLMICCISAGLNAQNDSDQYVDFQIVAQDDISIPIYRSPALIPIQGYYVSSLNTLYLSFAYDLGSVNIRIENVTEGVYYSNNFPTDSGTQTIILSSDSGLHSITLSVPGGLQYKAELLL